MMVSILLLTTVLLAAGGVVLLTTSLLMAQALLRPPRMTDGKAIYVLQRLSPGDLSMHFSDVRFSVRDQANPREKPIELAAWWIPHPSNSDRCVILLHGYADAKVGAIAWAPAWHALGYHILAIDLRAHGESGGRDCTAGFFERHDLNQVIDQLRADHPKKTAQLVLFGASLGAAVALATAAQRDDLTAVVMDSPFADYRSAVYSHAQRLGLPTGIGLSMATWIAEKISGADFTVVGPLKQLGKVHCPVMMIRGENENTVSGRELDALDQAMSRRPAHDDDVTWIVPAAGHLMGMAREPQAYVEHLSRFLARIRTEPLFSGGAQHHDGSPLAR